MRFLLPFLLLSSLYAAKSSVDDKIQKTSSEIGTYAKTQEQINKKMDETAKAILEHEKEIAQQQLTLKKLQEELVEKEGDYGANVQEINSLKTVQEDLKKTAMHLKRNLFLPLHKVFPSLSSLKRSIVQAKSPL